MMTTGKRTIVAHIHSDFGENAGCCIASNPRYRTSQFHLLLVRCEFLLNLLVEFFDHLFNKLHMFQSLPDEQAMMITHAVSFNLHKTLTEEKQQRRYVVALAGMLLHCGRHLLFFM